MVTFRRFVNDEQIHASVDDVSANDHQRYYLKLYQLELNSMTDTVQEFMFWAETQAKCKHILPHILASCHFPQLRSIYTILTVEIFFYSIELALMLSDFNWGK